jgi:hypothetical protein
LEEKNKGVFPILLQPLGLIMKENIPTKARVSHLGINKLMSSEVYEMETHE